MKIFFRFPLSCFAYSPLQIHCMPNGSRTTALTSVMSILFAVSGTKYLCGNFLTWCLSFHQQHHKLDCGQHWLDKYWGLSLAVSARISLPGLMAAASFFPQTTVQTGLRRVPVWQILMSVPLQSPARISLPELLAMVCFFPPTTVQVGLPLIPDWRTLRSFLLPSPAQISLPELMVMVCFFPQITGQAGLQLIMG